MDYAKVLLAVCPHGKAAIREGFAAALPRLTLDAELSTEWRMGLFIGQCAHESAGLQTATEYASGQAYEGRRDLGNVQAGDGRRFKGRGLIQLTGRANYAAAGKDLGVDLVGAPEQAAEFPMAANVSGWFWRVRDLNARADTSDEAAAIVATTKRINGGTNGLSSRTAYIRKAWQALHDLRGTLIATAAEQTQIAKQKGRAAGGAIVAAGGAVAGAQHPASQAMIGSSGVVMVMFVGGLLVIGGLALFMAIRKHQDAAQALLTAAKGA